MDTLLVRSDEDGNIWIRGITFGGTNALVTKIDQLWLKSCVGPPFYWDIGIGYSVVVYYSQMRWLGYQDGEGHDRCAAYIQGSLDEPVEEEPMSCPFSEVIAHARRFLPHADLSADLIWLAGEDAHLAGGSFSICLLAGLGPLWVPVTSDMTEWQGTHYELSEAFIDGQHYSADNATVARRCGWAQVKADYQPLRGRLP